MQSEYSVTKRMLRWAVAVIMLILLIGSGSVFSYAEATASGECGENATWSIEGGVLTISGEGYTDSYSSSQSAPWNSYADQVKDLVIEEGITSIGSRAFRSMSALESVSFPESLTEIGISAFYQCENLKEVTLTPSLTSVRDSAFGSCRGLETVIIDTRSSINFGNIFDYNANISNIFVTKDADVSLDTLKALADIGTVNIEESRTDFSSEDGVIFDAEKTALLYYPRMKTATSYTVPASVVSINMDAFKGVWYLESVDLGNVETVGYGAFYEANALKRLVLPATLKQVDTFSFSHFKSTLETLEVNSDFVQNENSFIYDKVKTLVIGDAVTKYPEAMYGLKELQSFSISEDNEYFRLVDSALLTRDATELLAYPALNTETRFTIPSSVKKVADNALSNAQGNRSKLTVVLPDDLILEEVGDNAFLQTKVEGTVHLVGDYKVGDYAFRASDIHEVVLGSPEDDGQTLEEGFISKRSIGDYAFESNYDLSDITAHGAPPESSGYNAFKKEPYPWNYEKEKMEAILSYPIVDFAAWDLALYSSEYASSYTTLIPVGRSAAPKVDRAVVLVVDTSGSMEGEPIELLKSAIKNFSWELLKDTSQMKASTQLALIMYNSDCSACGFSTNPFTFYDYADTITATGGTNMYDGLAMAGRYLKAIDAIEKDLVIMTDGLPQHGTTLDVGPFTNEEYGRYYAHANAVYNLYCTLPQSTRIFTMGYYHSQQSDQEYALSSRLLHLIQNSGFFEVTKLEDLVGQFEDLVYTLLSQIETERMVTINEKQTEDGPINEVKIQYSITNGDELTAANIKAKIDLSDREALGLELAPGQMEEINIGDIRAGEKVTVEWVLHAPVLTSDKDYLFGVTVGGDNIRPVKRYYDLSIPAASPGSDIYNTIANNERWSFLNEQVESYYIDSKLKNRLKKVFTKSEMALTEKQYFKKGVKFSGSCYGMAASTAMFKKGLMTVEAWQNGAVTASEITLSDKTTSLLTYFQVLQNDESLTNMYMSNTASKETVNGKKVFKLKPLKTRITNLVNALDKNGCALVGISFGGYTSNNEYKGFGHALIAYGKPFKLGTPYTAGGVSYDMCINTYDVNTCTSEFATSYVTDSRIYYTSDMSKFCIPYYMSSDKCTRELKGLKKLSGNLDQIIDDVSIFSSYNPETDFSHHTAEEKNEGLGIRTNSSNLKVILPGKIEPEYIRGTDLAEELGLWAWYSRMFLPGDEGDSWLNLYSAEPEGSYTIQTEEDQPLEVMASYDGSASFVEGSKDAAATLAGPGQVSISDNEGDYNVKMVLDEDAGFGDMVEVNGDDNSSITITKETNCFRISTEDDGLTDVAVTIEKGDTASETTLNSELNTLYVSADGSDGIAVSEEQPAPVTPPAPAVDPAAAQAAAAARAEAARQGVADSKIPKVKGLKKSKVKKTSITVKWTKFTKAQLKKSKATKYEIWVCPNVSFGAADTKIKTVGKGKSSAKISGLKKNAKYYVKVRAIRTVGAVKYVGKWSSRKTIKTPKK